MAGDPRGHVVVAGRGGGDEQHMAARRLGQLLGEATLTAARTAENQAELLRLRQCDLSLLIARTTIGHRPPIPQSMCFDMFRRVSPHRRGEAFAPSITVAPIHNERYSLTPRRSMPANASP